MQKNHLVFHSFNALRFFAFFRVFLLHLPLREGNQFWRKLISDGGSIGVDFFFVLSGFLITYLLVYEKQQSGKINGYYYFLRRSLRIWPLFFTGIGIAYFYNFITTKLHPGSSSGYSPNILYSISFLENYQMILHNDFPRGGPLRAFWSLCVEEHFYLLWFFIFLLFPTKHLPKIFTMLWLAGIAYRVWFYLNLPENNYYDIDILSNLDYFCAGGFAGWWVACKPDWTDQKPKQMSSKWLYCLIVLAIGTFYLNQYLELNRTDAIYFPVIYATVFAGFIFVIATRSVSFHFDEKNIFSKLGKISYGLYVYHLAIILPLAALLKQTKISLENNINFFLLAVISFALTVATSFLSYKYLELPFLNLKDKFRS
ncbi:MAG TPA: acyltransferase [Puia sp.]|nr:acyltransferase [Puia sp.]